MSFNSGDQTATEDSNKLGPDLFGYYAREAAELLSQDEHLPPFSSYKANGNNGIINPASSFSHGLGAQLSEFKKERLKTLLRQSVFSLTEEINEMANPVFSVCRIRLCLRYKESLLSSNTSACQNDQSQHPQKKHKASPVISNPNSGSTTIANVEAMKENAEIDDDLRIILNNDSSKVEELLKKHSGELSDTLDHMEQKLEDLLNVTMTTCRPMTITEKQHLRKMIQGLPPSHLDGIVDIIEKNTPPRKSSCDDNEVYVNLDDLNDRTLWRLYFYIRTFHATLENGS
ncbi:uncharacterized protein LOC127239802 [Andrographis paniculata]|uniref:uncharacterized protein LOC127239802 n=1 Tax=Andrographis paniculata TaxID=175694 RepID=UPI0021E8F91D|nr:uncharacterized protein LOC127239802 [Andrographis paniculata]XP_051114085.1 uncharacterized protein LOC127239802 [Andrographis paniculata]